MDDDLKLILATLVAKIDADSAENAAFRAENAAFRAEGAIFRAEIRARLDGIDRRLDDQARIIAALVSTRIAAIPEPA